MSGQRGVSKARICGGGKMVVLMDILIEVRAQG